MIITAATSKSKEHLLLADHVRYYLVSAKDGEVLRKSPSPLSSVEYIPCPVGRWSWKGGSPDSYRRVLDQASRQTTPDRCPLCLEAEIRWLHSTSKENGKSYIRPFLPPDHSVPHDCTVTVPLPQTPQSQPSNLSSKMQEAVKDTVTAAIPIIVEATRVTLQNDSGIEQAYQSVSRRQAEAAKEAEDGIRTIVGDARVFLEETARDAESGLQKTIAEMAQREVSARVPVEHVVVVEHKGTGERTRGELPQGMTTPALDQEFAVSGDTAKTLETVIAIADSGKPVLLMVTGPHGSGKTSLARQIAARRRSPFGIIPFGAKQEAREVIGEEQFSPDKGTWFRPGLFPSYTGVSGSVVLCDEFNRVENPKVHGALFDWLQEGSYTTDAGETYTIAPGVIIVATMNEGYDYAGADMLDIAMRGRFFEVQMEMPPAEVASVIVSKKSGMPLDEVQRFVSMLGSEKSLPEWMTMRGLLKAAELIVNGLTWRLAVAAAFNTMEDGKRNSILADLQTSRPQEEVDTAYRRW